MQGLVRNFPSTEMTVYRISNKIRPAKQETGVKDENRVSDSSKCLLCLGRLDNVNQKSGASARNDLNFTQNLLEGVFGDPGAVVDLVQKSPSDSAQPAPSDPHLCYSCNLVMKETKLNNAEKSDYLTLLPAYNLAPQLTSEEQILDKLKGVLIED